MGYEYPHINEETCIACGLCVKACPVDKNYVFSTLPHAVYAAWNKDAQARALAASGGIATAVYQYALAQGIKTFGVKFVPPNAPCYIEIKSEKDIELCRNSKYVFSDITPVLPDIKRYLANGEKVIIIALPCQAAAVLSYLGARDPNLLIIDIVCHGVCPAAYLDQHIAAMEQRADQKATAVHFRDPKFGTGKFVFSLYDGENMFYDRGVYRNDVYQIGYHKALTYRENCYSCKYATLNRIGDMTLSDFSGLGRLAPFTHERKSVSCVMVSSSAGDALLDALAKVEMIQAEQCPCEEAFRYEKMLSHPSVPHKAIDIFRREYENSQNFEASAHAAVKKDICKNMLCYYLRVDEVKRIIAKCVPKRAKKFLKKLVKR